MRAGIGELEPSDRGYTRDVIRNAFIRALFDFDDKYLYALVDRFVPHLNDKELKYRAALEWATESGLEEWCADTAVEILEYYIDLIKSKSSEVDVISIAREMSAEKIRFEHWDWNPVFLTKTEFLADCRTAFEKWLSDYVAAVEAKALKEGLVRTKEKRNRGHLLWLVRFQIGRESVADICRGLNESRAAGGLGRSYTRQAIEKAIKDLARTIELPLRSLPRLGEQ